MWEAIEVIQKLFTGKDVKHAGTLLQDGDLPALDDAGRAAADLRRDRWPDHGQARRATVDGIITPGATVEKVAGVLAKFDEGAAEAGREPGSAGQDPAAAPVVGVDR